MSRRRRSISAPAAPQSSQSPAPLDSLHDVDAAPAAGTARRAGSAAAPSSALRSVLAAVARAARDIFVPSGALPPDYALFQALDCVQAASSYLRGVLTLHATLRGAGLSSDGNSAAAAAAVAAFILKEGSSHVGSLLFAWRLGRKFDSEVKFYRLAADLANDVGLTLELVAPLAGAAWFLPLTCSANVAKALCGVAAGATRVAVSAHFAGSSADGASVGEMAAKEGAQETAVTLLGLVLGLRLAGVLNASVGVQLVAFAVLTAVHVFANYAAVRVLQLRTLNRSRLILLLDHRHTAAAAATGAARQRSIAPWRPPTPAELATVDPVLPLQYGSALDALSAGAYSALSAATAGVWRRIYGAAPGGGLAPQPLRCTEGMRLHLGCSSRELRAAAALPDCSVVLLVYAVDAARGPLPMGSSSSGTRAAAASSSPVSSRGAGGGGATVPSTIAYKACSCDAALRAVMPRAAQEADDAFLVAVGGGGAPSLTAHVAFMEGATAPTRALAVAVALSLARVHAAAGIGDAAPARALAAAAAACDVWGVVWSALAAAGYAGVALEEGGTRVTLRKETD